MGTLRQRPSARSQGGLSDNVRRTTISAQKPLKGHKPCRNIRQGRLKAQVCRERNMGIASHKRFWKRQFPRLPNRVPGSVGGISRCHNDNRGNAKSKLLAYRHDNDVLNRSMRTDSVCHDFLATPHRKPKSADSAAQSAEPRIPVEHIQEDKERTAL